MTLATSLRELHQRIGAAWTHAPSGSDRKRTLLAIHRDAHVAAQLAALGLDSLALEAADAALTWAEPCGVALPEGLRAPSIPPRGCVCAAQGAGA